MLFLKKRLTTYCLGMMLCASANTVFAHTSFKDQATEGTTAYNALQIGHTCTNEAKKQFPVIAQSVVFPTANPTVMRSRITNATTNPVTTEETPTTLEEEITDTAGLANKADLVQDRNIFSQQNETYDANGALIGFYGTKGNLANNLRGLVPFRFSPVTFKATSCAKRMLVKVAVADICKRTFPPSPGTANVWIPTTTTKFSNSALDGIGSPATLTINRNLSKNPLPPGCPVNADSTATPGYDVVVTPSKEDIDAHLPIPGYWE